MTAWETYAAWIWIRVSVSDTDTWIRYFFKNPIHGYVLLFFVKINNNVY